MIIVSQTLPGFAVTPQGDLTADKDPLDYMRNSMPRNVSALITSKVDRLALSQQTLLKFAAVVGYQFSQSMVTSLLPEEDRARVVPQPRVAAGSPACRRSPSLAFRE